MVPFTKIRNARRLWGKMINSVLEILNFNIQAHVQETARCNMVGFRKEI